MKNRTFLTEQKAQEVANQLLNQPAVNIHEIVESFPILRDCEIHKGKVTTSIFGGNLEAPDGTPLRIMVRTPRISTHDVGRGEIPKKGEVLAVNHNMMRKLVAPVLPHAQQESPPLTDSSIVTVSANLKPIMVEFVLRAYNAYTTTTTSLCQHYLSGARNFCGHILPDELQHNGKLPFVMDTPSTKEENDRSVAPAELYDMRVCTEEQYRLMKTMALAAFDRVSVHLAKRGIILADTKIEFGVDERSGEIIAIDELFTMDSSRFWPVENWEAARGKPERVVSWSKEFARGFSKGDQSYTDDERVAIAVRYMLGIQELTGEPFVPKITSNEDQIRSTIKNILSYYCLVA